MIAIIVTAYKPDAGFVGRFQHLLGICGAIIVSDNTPGGHREFDLPAGFHVLRHMCNLGLAPALNLGIQAARSMGADTVVLFDQDSTPDADFITSMIEQLALAQDSAGSLCCVGPTHLDDGAGSGGADEAAAHGANTIGALQEVTCLPTSGMAFHIDKLSDDDLFSPTFFLDLVDFEWCWRLRAQGWRFFRSTQVVMLHRLGEAERRMLGFTFHIPAPYRHYYQVRDSLRLAGLSYVPLYSKLRLIGILPLKAALYPLLLDRGAERLRWMWLGLRDGARGVQGIGAAASRLAA